MSSPSFDTNAIKQKLIDASAVILRYQLIISIVVTAVFLMYAVITVNSILNNTTDPDYIASQQQKGIKTRFDDETITKINDLRSRQENPSLDLPEGRRNPFRE